MNSIEVVSRILQATSNLLDLINRLRYLDYVRGLKQVPVQAIRKEKDYIFEYFDATPDPSKQKLYRFYELLARCFRKLMNIACGIVVRPELVLDLAILLYWVMKVID